MNTFCEDILEGSNTLDFEKKAVLQNEPICGSKYLPKIFRFNCIAIMMWTSFNKGI